MPGYIRRTSLGGYFWEDQLTIVHREMRRNHLKALRTLIGMKLPFLQGDGSISPLATGSGVFVCASFRLS